MTPPQWIRARAARARPSRAHTPHEAPRTHDSEHADTPRPSRAERLWEGAAAVIHTRARLLGALLAGLIVVAVAAALLVSRFGGGGSAYAVPLPVHKPLPSGAKIGVVLTLGNTPEARQWRDAANGAVVARERLAQQGQRLELVTVNDEGTARGAQRAVAELARKKVAGIVYASAGTQLPAALAETQRLGIPTILPFGAPGFDNPELVGKNRSLWSFAADVAKLRAAFLQAVDEPAETLVLDAGSGVPPGLERAAVWPVDTTGTTDINDTAQRIAAVAGVDAAAGGRYLPESVSAALAQPRTAHEAVLREHFRSAPPHTLVVSGPADTAAELTAALQRAGVTAPIVLPPQATSPRFAEVFTARGGVASEQLTAVGTAWTDATALTRSDSGQAMSQYLNRVRALAADAAERRRGIHTRTLTGDADFAAVATAADARAHDAVIALAAALREARSADPAAVARTLNSLTVTPQDGLSRGALSFATLTVSPQLLTASATPLGLRPPEAACAWLPLDPAAAP